MPTPWGLRVFRRSCHEQLPGDGGNDGVAIAAVDSPLWPLEEALPNLPVLGHPLPFSLPLPLAAGFALLSHLELPSKNNAAD